MLITLVSMGSLSTCNKDKNHYLMRQAVLFELLTYFSYNHAFDLTPLTSFDTWFSSCQSVRPILKNLSQNLFIWSNKISEAGRLRTLIKKRPYRGFFKDAPRKIWNLLKLIRSVIQFSDERSHASWGVFCSAAQWILAVPFASPSFSDYIW